MGSLQVHEARLMKHIEKEQATTIHTLENSQNNSFRGRGRGFFRGRSQGKGRGRVKSRTYCKNTGHLESNCLSKQVCTYCMKKGHKEVDFWGKHGDVNFVLRDFKG